MKRSFASLGIGVAAVAALAWIAWFWHSGSFGLYEDDYASIPAAMESSLPEFLDTLGETAFGPRAHGRPLFFTLIALLSLLASKLGGTPSSGPSSAATHCHPA